MSGICVPVRATNRSTPCDQTNSPVSGRPSLLSSVSRTALNATSPGLLSEICQPMTLLAVTK